jgi:protein-tyrosine kinase
VLGVKRRQTTSINKSAEQVRILRSNLEKQLEDNESHILMITSPKGLSPHVYVSSHLAVSFAEQGKNVLLVDADVRNPGLHNYFNMPNTKGFVDVVLYGDNIFTHARSNYMDRLSILTAGNLSNSEEDLWIRKKVRDAVKTWKDKFDLVLFHSPGYLELSDAQVLIDQCDGVLLVVQSGRTKMKDAAAAKQQIDRSKKPILGVIYQKG